MSRNSLKPRGYRVREGLALVLTVSCIAVVFLSLSLTGCGEEKPPPLPVEEENPAVEFISGLSADQGRTVDELGYPDHFFITIDPASSDRVERWTYFSQGKALDFDNGRLFGEEPIEDESAAYPPTDLRPQDFDATMTPGEAAQLLGEPLYTQEVQDSLMPENTIIVYDKAVLLYRDEQLIGVDTQVSPPRLNAPRGAAVSSSQRTIRLKPAEKAAWSGSSIFLRGMFRDIKRLIWERYERTQ